MSSKWMIYGANGYTGRLIAEEAKKRGMQPVLAGRNAEAVGALADQLGFERRVFACTDAEIVAEQIKDLGLVLLCAGPFSATSKPFLKACLKAKVNYLDITGEIPVFERFLSKSQAFQDAGIVAIPGAGFDVVPSDCLAALLKKELPTANKLVLAIHATESPSPGTLKTVVEGLYVGAAVRRDGNLVRVSPTHEAQKIPFSGGPKLSVLIPWGDLSTAYRSTGIPNIQTFFAIGEKGYRFVRWTKLVRPILAWSFLQRLIKRQIEKRVPGPDALTREKSRYEIFGEVRDASGKSVRLCMGTPNGYDFTADAALTIAQRVLDGKVRPGAWTPSQALGAEFALTLKGVRLEKLVEPA